MACVRDVVIVGGGIGGLALGIAARQAGIATRIVERTATPSDRGAGVVLAPNGVKALQALGVARSVLDKGWTNGAAGQRPKVTPFISSTGRVLSSFTASDLEGKWGAPMVSILRADLRDALLERAEEVGV